MSESGASKFSGEVIPFERGLEIGRHRQEKAQQLDSYLKFLHQKSVELKSLQDMHELMVDQSLDMKTVGEKLDRVEMLMAQGLRLKAEKNLSDEKLHDFAANIELMIGSDAAIKK